MHNCFAAIFWALSGIDGVHLKLFNEVVTDWWNIFCRLDTVCVARRTSVTAL